MSYNSNVTFWNLIECDPGFRGENCSKTCPDGYYGRKCIEKCNCNSDTQFCHHVCGCLQRSNTTDNITTNNTKVVSSYSVETCFSSSDTSTDSTGWYFVFWIMMTMIMNKNSIKSTLLMKPVLLTPTLIVLVGKEKNIIVTNLFSFSYIGWKVMSDSTISRTCYNHKLIYMVLPKEEHFCFDLVCCVVCCWKNIIQFVMEHLCHTHFHCIMIDWLWFFNAVSAILQS